MQTESPKYKEYKRKGHKVKNEIGGDRNIERGKKKSWGRLGKKEQDVDRARRGVRFSVSLRL